MALKGPVDYPQTPSRIELARVVSWKDNPASRMKRDQKYLRLLASVGRKGMIERVDVTAEPPIYRLVRGHQRCAVARELGWTLVDAFIWHMPFEEALALLQPTEAHRRVWGGLDNGQMVLSQGVTRAVEILQESGYLDYAQTVIWASEQLGGCPDVWHDILSRFGIRVLKRLQPLESSEWSLERLCRALLAHGTYKALEEPKGITKTEKLALLEAWELGTLARSVS